MNALKSAAITATKLATGQDTGSEISPSGTRLEAFLTSLVTYPFLHLASAISTATSGLHGKSQYKSSAAAAADHLVRAMGKGAGPQSGSAQTEGRGYLTDYEEGKALVSLERWCGEPVLTSQVDDVLFKAREWLLSNIAWQQEDLDRVLATLGHSASSPPVLPEDASFPRSPQTKQWLIKAMQLLIQGLDYHLGARSPDKTLEMVVSRQLARLAGHDVAPASTVDADLKPNGDTNPVNQLSDAIAPNIRHVTLELQRKHHLKRNRTWVEFLNVLLGVVRMWLNTVAFGFFLFATGLRILGNGMSALGGLFAFTVVLSIAISVLSAIIFLGASAADATGTFLEYMARFTDLAKRRTARRGPGWPQDKLGPKNLGKVSFEELEDMFSLQLLSYPALGRGMPLGGIPMAGLGNLRNRPDVPRIAHDPLLVTAYDAGLVDSSGALQPYVTPEDVIDHWDPNGFFGLAPVHIRRAGAVLLLRLLAWKQIAGIMSPPTTAGTASEMERALRYVFIAGVDGSGADTLYRAITGLPQEYKVLSGEQGAEIKPILRHRTSFALLCPASPVRKSSWVTNINHGVVSSFVFLVAADTRPEALGLSESPAGAVNGTPIGRQLEMVWQALTLRKPVLFVLNNAASIQDRLQAEPGAASESLVMQWKNCLKEEAHKRGLESENITVMLTELMGVPPVGAVGVTQVEDWLMQALSSAPQSR